MSFAQSIQDMMVLQMHPDREATKAAMQSFVKQQQAETDRLSAETFDAVSDKLIKAIKNEAPQSVIDGYERMLARLSSS